MTALWIVVGVAATLLLAAGWFFADVVLKVKVTTPETVEREWLSGSEEAWDSFDTMKKEAFDLEGERGARLRGYIIWPDGEAARDRVAICCHGFGCNFACALKYAQIFRGRGWPVVVYDHRHSGYSTGRATTMGYYESMDLQRVVQMVRARFGQDCRVVTQGESMGAATVLIHAAKYGGPSAVLADCPFADCREELAYKLRQLYHLPPFPMLPLASLISGLRTGFFFGRSSPVSAIAQARGMADIPVFFAHGVDDEYIPIDSSRRMAKAKKGVVELYECPGADHAMSYSTAPDEYCRRVNAFLDKCGL